jgi:hypothetical protein
MADDAAVSDEQLQQEVTQRATEVDSFLRKKDKVHALQKCLENPPVSSKSQDIKVSYHIIELTQHFFQLCILRVIVVELIAGCQCRNCGEGFNSHH